MITMILVAAVTAYAVILFDRYGIPFLRRESKNKRVALKRWRAVSREYRAYKKELKAARRTIDRLSIEANTFLRNVFDEYGGTISAPSGYAPGSTKKTGVWRGGALERVQFLLRHELEVAELERAGIVRTVWKNSKEHYPTSLTIKGVYINILQGKTFSRRQIEALMHSRSNEMPIVFWDRGSKKKKAEGKVESARVAEFEVAKIPAKKKKALQ